MSGRRSPIADLCRRGLVAAAAFLLGGGLALGAAAPSSLAATAGAGSPTSFDAFRFIGEKNIFNPNRIARSGDEPAPPPVETISLVGTMQDEKGPWAFFDSPDRTLRQALHEGDTIAQFTVTRISPDGVELTRDSKQISLAMGQQLRRPDGGDWAVSTATRVERVPAGGPAPNVPADATDTSKQRMQQRQQ